MDHACPVCLATPRGKYFLCPNDHNICEKCKAKIDKCPGNHIKWICNCLYYYIMTLWPITSECRTSYGNPARRNKFFERFIENSSAFKLACKFSGCSFEGLKSERELHETSCNFNIEQCKNLGCYRQLPVTLFQELMRQSCTLAPNVKHYTRWLKWENTRLMNVVFEC